MTDREYHSLNILIQAKVLNYHNLEFIDRCLGDVFYTDWDGLIEWLLNQPTRPKR
jgi:hypothetical protein